MNWTRELTLALSSTSDMPLFLQIGRAIVEGIRQGRLHPGAPLPGSRTLSQTLKVNRNTVLAAYRELEAQGIVETRQARGTYVAASPPMPASSAFGPVRTQVPAGLGFELPEAPEFLPAPLAPPGLRAVSVGTPDLRLLPTAPLARAYRRALAQRRSTSLLAYGDPRGHAELREALARMLAQLRALACTQESVLVTRGSHAALDLAARTLIRPGDAVAVEALGCRPAWGSLQQAGAELVPVPVDGSGLVVDALEQVCRERRLRAVYITPHHQYPTTVILSADRRIRLLELARQHRLAIIEDDYDHEFHYEGRPILPLASADDCGVVLYIGSLSKVLAPGLRVGFLVAPEPFVERAAAVRRMVDRQGDHAVECAIAELLQDGEVERHIRRARRVYHQRRDVLAQALRSELAGAVDFELPAGGLAIWARTAPEIDVDAWVDGARGHGLLLSRPTAFDFHGRSLPHLRLGFAAYQEPELRDTVEKLAAALSGIRCSAGPLPQDFAAPRQRPSSVHRHAAELTVS